MTLDRGKEAFDKFLETVNAVTDSDKDVMKLLNRRFKKAKDVYLSSPEFLLLIQTTNEKIQQHPSTKYVHIREVVTELKAYEIEKKPKDARLTSLQQEADVDNWSTFSDTDVSGICDNQKKRLQSDPVARVASPCLDSPMSRNAEFINLDDDDENLHTTDEAQEETPRVTPEISSVEDTKEKSCNPDTDKKETDAEIDCAEASKDLPGCNVSLTSKIDSPLQSLPLSDSENKQIPTKDFPLETAEKCSSKDDNEPMDNDPSTETVSSQRRSPRNHEASNPPKRSVSPEIKSSQKRQRSPDKTNSPKRQRLGESSDSQGPSSSKSSKPDASSSSGVIPDNTDVTPSTSGSQTKVRSTTKQVERLEYLLGALHDKIRSLEESEMSLDDLGDEDTSYTLLSRCKEKFVKVWNKLCQVKGRQPSTGRPTERKFKFEGTRYTEINKKIERFVNKFHVFPDYQDIHDLILACNRQYQLKLGKRLIDQVAKDAFTQVGNQLQERRQDDYTENAGCHLTDQMKHKRDPANYDRHLQAKLEANRQLGRSRLEEVIQKFAYKQDCSESSGNDDDDESNDDEVKVTKSTETVEADDGTRSSVEDTDLREKEDLQGEGEGKSPREVMQVGGGGIVEEAHGKEKDVRLVTEKEDRLEKIAGFLKQRVREDETMKNAGLSGQKVGTEKNTGLPTQTVMTDMTQDAGTFSLKIFEKETREESDKVTDFGNVATTEKDAEQNEDVESGAADGTDKLTKKRKKEVYREVQEKENLRLQRNVDACGSGTKDHQESDRKGHHSAPKSVKNVDKPGQLETATKSADSGKGKNCIAGQLPNKFGAKKVLRIVGSVARVPETECHGEPSQEVHSPDVHKPGTQEVDDDSVVIVEDQVGGDEMPQTSKGQKKMEGEGAEMCPTSKGQKKTKSGGSEMCLTSKGQQKTESGGDEMRQTSQGQKEMGSGGSEMCLPSKGQKKTEGGGDEMRQTLKGREKTPAAETFMGGGGDALEKFLTSMSRLAEAAYQAPSFVNAPQGDRPQKNPSTKQTPRVHRERHKTEATPTASDSQAPQKNSKKGDPQPTSSYVVRDEATVIIDCEQNDADSDVVIQSPQTVEDQHETSKNPSVDSSGSCNVDLTAGPSPVTVDAMPEENGGKGRRSHPPEVPSKDGEILISIGSPDVTLVETIEDATKVTCSEPDPKPGTSKEGSKDTEKDADPDVAKNSGNESEKVDSPKIACEFNAEEIVKAALEKLQNNLLTNLPKPIEASVSDEAGHAPTKSPSPDVIVEDLIVEPPPKVKTGSKRRRQEPTNSDDVDVEITDVVYVKEAPKKILPRGKPSVTRAVSANRSFSRNDRSPRKANIHRKVSVPSVIRKTPSVTRIKSTVTRATLGGPNTKPPSETVRNPIDLNSSQTKPQFSQRGLVQQGFNQRNRYGARNSRPTLTAGIPCTITRAMPQPRQRLPYIPQTQNILPKPSASNTFYVPKYNSPAPSQTFDSGLRIQSYRSLAPPNSKPNSNITASDRKKSQPSSEVEVIDLSD